MPHAYSSVGLLSASSPIETARHVFSSGGLPPTSGHFFYSHLYTHTVRQVIISRTLSMSRLVMISGELISRQGNCLKLDAVDLARNLPDSAFLAQVAEDFTRCLVAFTSFVARTLKTPPDHDAYDSYPMSRQVQLVSPRRCLSPFVSYRTAIEGPSG